MNAMPPRARIARRLAAGLFAVAVVAPCLAAAAALPPDAHPGMEGLLVFCTVTPAGLSDNCRFGAAITSPTERLKAGTELGYLDAHPFRIFGAQSGAEVEVFVRLSVSRAGPGFRVTDPDAIGQPPAQAAIEDPVWVHSPHDPWGGAFIPDDAFRTNEAGRATVSCTVTGSGALANCWLKQEAPTGRGFGYGVLRLMQFAQMTTLTANGQPVAGRPYDLTLVYTGSGGDPRLLPETPSWQP
jgi:hypothetical protein